MVTAQEAPQVQETTGQSLSSIAKFERLVIVIALIGLMVTGLPQEFSVQGWADFMIKMLGGIESTRILHRFFAILLIAEALFYTLGLIYRRMVLKITRIGFPTGRDWGDFFKSIPAILGGDVETGKPYALRIEYLVTVVSLALLILTGAILLNPIAFSSILPGAIIPIVQKIHADHAVLFTAFVILWRIGVYFIWRPARPPLRQSAEDAAQLAARRQRYVPVAAVIVLVVIVAAVWIVTSESTALQTIPRREAHIYVPQFVPDEGDATVGEAVWSTLRCALCHGDSAQGGVNGAPALPTQDLTFESFVQKVRTGSEAMPAFSREELPDSYMLHLWAWLSERQ